jgi:restriction endonuclease S subunit
VNSKKKNIESLGRGIAQKNINLAILRNIKIPVPPLTKQKEIVKEIQKRDYEIEKYKDLIVKEEEAKYGILKKYI